MPCAEWNLEVPQRNLYLIRSFKKDIQRKNIKNIISKIKKFNFVFENLIFTEL